MGGRHRATSVVAVWFLLFFTGTLSQECAAEYSSDEDEAMLSVSVMFGCSSFAAQYERVDIYPCVNCPLAAENVPTSPQQGHPVAISPTIKVLAGSTVSVTATGEQNKLYSFTVESQGAYWIVDNDAEVNRCKTKWTNDATTVDTDMFPIDYALVMVANLSPNNKMVGNVSANCWECKIDSFVVEPLGSVLPPSMIWVSWDVVFKIGDPSEPRDPVVVTVQLRERGIYWLIVAESPEGEIKWQIRTINDPPNPYLPILWAFLAFFGFGAIMYSLGFLRRWRRREGVFKSSVEEPMLRGTEGPSLGATPGQQQKERLRSLDSFRGMSLVIMIFVNFGGGDYWFFNHSLWNGLTVADLVFPWFIWIMGTSMAISFDSQRRHNVPKLTMLYKIVRRAIILFCLGLFFNNGYVLDSWRIPGVLQRFAVSYLAVALVIGFVPRDGRWSNSWHPAEDILSRWAGLLIVLALIIIQLFIQLFLDVPGCGRGYMGPGGIGNNGEYYDCPGGAAGYIDRVVFGSHMYTTPTSLPMYYPGVEHVGYDPEGLLGCCNSIAMCYFGFICGNILIYYKEHQARLTRWLIWGAGMGCIGTALCFGEKNSGVIPINKNLWSLSFILCLSAMAFVLFSIFYYLIDVKQWWSGAPFRWTGMNSILVYCAHETLHEFFPFSWHVDHPTHGNQLAQDIVGASLWVLISWYMHWNKFYIKI